MFIPTRPAGVISPSDDDRHPIWQVISGDTWTLRTLLTLADDTPATPDNSFVLFALSEDKFSTTPLVSLDWSELVEVDSIYHPGLVDITIPAQLAISLRRGSYAFSLTLTALGTGVIQTPIVGTLLVDYAPGSPNHSIPYKDNY